MNKIDKIEKDIKKLKEEIKYNKNKDKSTTINDIKVGEQFIYRGHNYTKLNNNNYCIIDDYDGDFMCCCFDFINNYYEDSVVLHYINGRKFMRRLNLIECDLKLHFDDTYVTILYFEQYDEYKKYIVNYPTRWMLRGIWRDIFHFSNVSAFDMLYVEEGEMHKGCICEQMGVRICITLKPGALVTRK